jgi:hypothetical protein
MKHISSGIMFLILLAGCGRGVDRSPSSALQAITNEEMHRHLFYLASDSLKGRNTPSPELDTAAAYIARQFSLAGILPVRGSYFQPVNLNIVNLGEHNGLRIRMGGKEAGFVIKEDFTPFDMTANREVRAAVVFAGYGITAPEFHYDDYASLDVKGKIVFVLRHEPGEEDSGSVFKGKLPTDYSNVNTKVRIAVEHGAAGVLVATDPLNHESLAPRGFPWPSLSKTIPRDALPITLGADEGTKVPVVHVGEAVMELLFGSVDSLRALQAKIDKAVLPHSYAIPGSEAWIQTSTQIREMPSRNVVGYIEGSDSVQKNELVVVGAHYDHVGYKKDHAAGEDYIFNGADDNASGTCALLGVAAGFGASAGHPGRSVLLIAFCGEEKGLFGSEYYARNPLFPLEKTVAMLNMDMVGRNAEDTLFLIGSESSPDLAAVAREEDPLVGFALVDQTLSSGGSDHMSFMKRNVPSLFFHSGLHRDYHTVRDNPELMNTRKIARTSQLVFLTARHLANDHQRYRYFPKPISLF